MSEFVRFSVSAGRQPPPQWQEIASAALHPCAPQKITPSPYGGNRVIFEFDYYPAGLDAVVDQLRGQHIIASFSVRHQYTAAERRAAELLILGTGGIVSSVEGTLRWQDVSICPFCECRTADWQFAPLRIVEQPRGAVLARVDHWPLVCSAELAQALQEAQVTGLELVPVGPDRPVQWYGLRATAPAAARGYPPDSPVPGSRPDAPMCRRSLVG